MMPSMTGCIMRGCGQKPVGASLSPIRLTLQVFTMAASAMLGVDLMSQQNQWAVIGAQTIARISQTDDKKSGAREYHQKK